MCCLVPSFGCWLPMAAAVLVLLLALLLHFACCRTALYCTLCLAAFLFTAIAAHFGSAAVHLLLQSLDPPQCVRRLLGTAACCLFLNTLELVKLLKMQGKSCHDVVTVSCVLCSSCCSLFSA